MSDKNYKNPYGEYYPHVGGRLLDNYKKGVYDKAGKKLTTKGIMQIIDYAQKYNVELPEEFNFKAPKINTTTKSTDTPKSNIGNEYSDFSYTGKSQEDKYTPPKASDTEKGGVFSRFIERAKQNRETKMNQPKELNDVGGYDTRGTSFGLNKEREERVQAARDTKEEYTIVDAINDKYSKYSQPQETETMQEPRQELDKSANPFTSTGIKAEIANKRIDITQIPEDKKEVANMAMAYNKEQSYWDTIVNTYKFHDLATAQAKEYYKAMLGEENRAAEMEEELIQMAQEHPEIFEQDNLPLLKDMLKQSASLAPFMKNVMLEGIEKGMAGAIGAGGAAALLGQAGPQALLPEETFTVPGAAAVGFKTGQVMGSFQESFMTEAGFAFKDMVDNGMDVNTARNAAVLVGLANAGIEMAQVGRIAKKLPVVGKALTQGVSNFTLEAAERYVRSNGGRVLLKGIAEFGKDIAIETGQEIAQEIVPMVTETGARKITGDENAKWSDLTNEESRKRILDVATSTLKGMPIVLAPGNVNVTANTMYTNHKAGKANQNIQDATSTMMAAANNPKFSPEQKVSAIDDSISQLDKILNSTTFEGVHEKAKESKTNLENTKAQVQFRQLLGAVKKNDKSQVTDSEYLTYEDAKLTLETLKDRKNKSEEEKATVDTYSELIKDFENLIENNESAENIEEKSNFMNELDKKISLKALELHEEGNFKLTEDMKGKPKITEVIDKKNSNATMEVNGRDIPVNIEGIEYDDNGNVYAKLKGSDKYVDMSTIKAEPSEQGKKQGYTSLQEELVGLYQSENKNVELRDEIFSQITEDEAIEIYKGVINGEVKGSDYGISKEYAQNRLKELQPEKQETKEKVEETKPEEVKETKETKEAEDKKEVEEKAKEISRPEKPEPEVFDKAFFDEDAEAQKEVDKWEKYLEDFKKYIETETPETFKISGGELEGQYAIVHPSNYEGYKYQITIMPEDGIPMMHKDIKEKADIGEQLIELGYNNHENIEENRVEFEETKEENVEEDALVRFKRNRQEGLEYAVRQDNVSPLLSEENYNFVEDDNINSPLKVGQKIDSQPKQFAKDEKSRKDENGRFEKPLYLKPQWILDHVEGGLNGELFRIPSSLKEEGTNHDKNIIKELTESMKKNGYDKEQPITITVTGMGEAWIYEGNHRLIAAKEVGIKVIPVKIIYYDLGKFKPYQWKPDQIVKKSYENESLAVEEGYITEEEKKNVELMKNYEKKREQRKLEKELKEYGFNTEGFKYKYETLRDRMDLVRQVNELKGQVAKHRNESVTIKGFVDNNVFKMIEVETEDGKLEARYPNVLDNVVKEKIEEISLENVKTGKPFNENMYQGKGTPKEEIYNGVDYPILGKGQYYATTEENAKIYGEVSEKEVNLENPLVISNDTQWRKLTKEAGWKYPNIFGASEKKSIELIDKLQNTIKEKGHDGVIIKLPMINGHIDETKAKTMGKVLGHNQVLVFDKVQETAKPKQQETTSLEYEVGDTVNTKTYDEVEIVAKDQSLITVVNENGTELQIGRKAFEKNIQEIVENEVEETVIEEETVEETQTEDTDKTYRYYTTLRPPAPGSVPRGFVNVEMYDNKTDGSWGYVEYNEPLSAKEIENYELREEVIEEDIIENEAEENDSTTKDKESPNYNSLTETLELGEKQLDGIAGLISRMNKSDYYIFTGITTLSNEINAGYENVVIYGKNPKNGNLTSFHVSPSGKSFSKSYDVEITGDNVKRIKSKSGKTIWESEAQHKFDTYNEYKDKISKYEKPEKLPSYSKVVPLKDNVGAKSKKYKGNKAWVLRRDLLNKTLNKRLNKVYEKNADTLDGKLLDQLMDESVKMNEVYPSEPIGVYTDNEASYVILKNEKDNIQFFNKDMYDFFTKKGIEVRTVEKNNSHASLFYKKKFVGAFSPVINNDILFSDIEGLVNDILNNNIPETVIDKNFLNEIEERKQNDEYVGKTFYDLPAYKIKVKRIVNGMYEVDSTDLRNNNTYENELIEVDEMEKIAKENTENKKKVEEKTQEYKERKKQQKKEEQKEAKKEAEKERKYNEDFGYTQNMPNFKKGKTLKVLNKKYNYSEGIGVMTRKDFIKKMVMEDASFTQEEVNNKNGYYVLEKGEDVLGRKITKTEYDYGKYLQRVNRKVPLDKVASVDHKQTYEVNGSNMEGANLGSFKTRKEARKALREIASRMNEDGDNFQRIDADNYLTPDKEMSLNIDYWDEIYVTSKDETTQETETIEETKKEVYEMTKEEIKTQQPYYKGIQVFYKSDYKGEGRQAFKDNKPVIYLGDNFFDREGIDNEMRKWILHHELNHIISNEYIHKDGMIWELIDSGLFGETKTTKDNETYFEGIFGDVGSNSLDETFTEALTSFELTPSALKKNHPKVYQFLVDNAEDIGIEVPDNVEKTEFSFPVKKLKKYKGQILPKPYPKKEYQYVTKGEYGIRFGLEGEELDEAFDNFISVERQINDIVIEELNQKDKYRVVGISGEERIMTNEELESKPATEEFPHFIEWNLLDEKLYETTKIKSEIRNLVNSPRYEELGKKVIDEKIEHKEKLKIIKRAENFDIPDSNLSKEEFFQRYEDTPYTREKFKKLHPEIDNETPGEFAQTGDGTLKETREKVKEAYEAEFTRSEIDISVDDIDREFAERAYKHISFDYEKLGKQIRKDYVSSAQEILDNLTKYVQNDEQREVLIEEFNRFKEGYIKKINAYLSAKSKTASPAITGSSNFPVRRNQKALDLERKRYQEIERFEDKAVRSIKKKLKNHLTEDQVDDAEFNRAWSDIAYNIAELVRIDKGESYLDKNAFKNSIKGKIERIFNRGDKETARKLLKEVDKMQEKYSIKIFTKRHSIWKILEEDTKPAVERKSPSFEKLSNEILTASLNEKEKLVLDFANKEAYTRLDDKVKNEIKRRFNYSRYQKAWISKGFWRNNSLWYKIILKDLGLDVKEQKSKVVKKEIKTAQDKISKDFNNDDKNIKDFMLNVYQDFEDSKDKARFLRYSFDDIFGIRLAGKYNANTRQKILSTIKGEKIAKSKSGTTAVKEAVMKYYEDLAKEYMDLKDSSWKVYPEGFDKDKITLKDINGINSTMIMRSDLNKVYGIDIDLGYKDNDYKKIQEGKLSDVETAKILLKYADTQLNIDKKLLEDFIDEYEFKEKSSKPKVTKDKKKALENAKKPKSSEKAAIGENKAEELLLDRYDYRKANLDEWYIDYSREKAKKYHLEEDIIYTKNVTARFANTIELPIDFIMENIEGGKSKEEEYIDTQEFSIKNIAKIKENIEQNGYIKDDMHNIFIVVRYNGDAFIAEGNHRIRAAKQAGLETIPVTLKYFDTGETEANKPFAPTNVIKQLMESEEQTKKRLNKIQSSATTKEIKTDKKLYRSARQDISSAVKLVDKYINNDIIEELKKYDNAKILPIIDKDNKNNQIPKALAYVVSEKTGFPIHTEVVKSNEYTGEKLNAIERMIEMPKYEGIIEEGQVYIITDDIYTKGSTVKKLVEYIHKKGGKVAQVFTLAHSENKILMAQEETLANIDKKLGVEKVEKILKQSGAIEENIEELTEGELQEIERFENIDAARQNILENGLGESIEGSSESLQSVEQINHEYGKLGEHKLQKAVEFLAGNNKKEIKNLHEIISELAAYFKVPVTDKNFRKRKFSGYYMPIPQTIHLKEANNIRTALHEFGHHIDHKYNFSINHGDLMKDLIEAILTERFKTSYSKSELPGEAVAEFFKYYITNPAVFDELAKIDRTDAILRFKEVVETEISKADFDKLMEAKQDIHKILSQGVTGIVKSQMVSYGRNSKSSGSLKDKILSKKNFVYTYLFDENKALSDLSKYVENVTGEELKPSNDPYKLMLNISRASQRAAGIIGMFDNEKRGTVPALNPDMKPFHEKSFAQVLSPIIEKDKEEFDLYLKNVHAIDLMEQGHQVFPSEVSVEDLKTLIKNAEETYPKFKQTAEELYEWWDSFMEAWLVDTGFLNPSAWASMKTKYPHYVPMFRAEENYIMTPEGKKIPTGKRSVGDQKAPIYRLSHKGNARATYSPTESMVLQINGIVNAQMKREVMLALDDMYKKGVEGIGEFFAKDATPMKHHSFNSKNLKMNLAFNFMIDYVKNKYNIEGDINNTIKNTIFGNENAREKALDELATKGADRQKLYTFTEEVREIMQDASVDVQAAYQQLFDLLGNAGYTAAPIVDFMIQDVITWFTPQKISKDEKVLSVIDRNNNTVFYRIHDENLFDSLMGLAPQEAGDVMKMIINARRTMTNLITSSNPFFGVISNFPRDIQTGLVFGHENNPMKYAQGIFESLKSVTLHDIKNQSFKSIGGGFGYSISGSQRDIVKEVYNKMGVKKANLFMRGMMAVEQFNDAIESGPRQVEFYKILNEKLAEGWSEKDALLEALYQSSDVTLNFMKKGLIMRENVFKTIPFFNAGLQGLDKLYRSYTNPETRKQVFIKSLVYLTIPTIMLSTIYKDDEDYKNVRQGIKDNYWLIKLGWFTDSKDWEDKFIRIPKPRDLAFIFSVLTERTMEILRGEDDAMYDLDTTFKNLFIPSFRTVFAPLIDVYANKNWFGIPIVPQRLQNLPVDYQYDDTTSNLAKLLAEIVPNGLGVFSSPKNIDYLLDQYLGIIGDIALPLTTDSESAIEELLLRRTTTDPVYSNDETQKFYSKLAELETAHYALTKKGVMTEQYDKRAYEFFKDRNSKLNKAWRLIREIQASEDYTQAEKDKMMRDIRKDILEFVKQTMETYKEYEKRKNN